MQIKTGYQNLLHGSDFPCVLVMKLSMSIRNLKDPVLSHYTSCASVIVFVCTGARLLSFSGVLLFSRQAFNCVEKNYYVSCFWSLKFAILKYVLKCCLINKVHD